MTTNVPQVSWTSYVALPVNATLTEFNTYNFTTTSSTANFTQTGSFSSATLVSGNSTTYWYGFNTQVNTVNRLVAGNVLASWVAPKWVTGNSALYAVYTCRTSTTGTTTLTHTATPSLFTSTYDPQGQVGAVANLTAGMTSITDTTQKQFSVYTPVGTTTNG